MPGRFATLGKIDRIVLETTRGVIGSAVSALLDDCGFAWFTRNAIIGRYRALSCSRSKDSIRRIPRIGDGPGKKGNSDNQDGYAHSTHQHRQPQHDGRAHEEMRGD